MACAVSREALRVLVEEKLAENALVQGAYFMDELRKIRHPHIELVRGKGLWIGLVLKKDGPKAMTYCHQLKEQGVLAKDTHDWIIRFAPPLVITREEVDWAMERIRRVFA